jgi:hypothetical protein
MLNILNKYKNEEFFYKILVKLFKEDCEKYSLLNKYIIENTRTQFIYGKKVIKRDYIFDIYKLIEYRSNYKYWYFF